jgi:predicted lipoprotein with Yx(FWY)xxD motif
MDFRNFIMSVKDVNAGLRRAAATMIAIAAFSPVIAASNVPATTPQGITLIEVSRELSSSQPQILWLRLGDADGRTLFVSDNDGNGISSCAAECAKEFPPLLAPRDAKPFGDWSLLHRVGGGRQWMYQSHPLYTWVQEKEPGEVATNVGLTETATLKLAESEKKAGSLMPPTGWKVARFTPAASMLLPDEIDVRWVASAEAVVLTDFNGFTLYAFDRDAKRDGATCLANQCKLQWRPVAAPALASTLREFSVVTRDDGSAQWAYKRQPLYTFAGDKLPGDVHGVGVNKEWTVAKLREDFRPKDVSVTTLEGYGDTLSVRGMTLYGAYPYEYRWGGWNLRDTFKYAYPKAKRLGAAACAKEDDRCLTTWRPFLAPADARSNGFWEPVERNDGTKQWAYKGSALYTCACDRAPGDHRGQAVYDFPKREGASDTQRAIFLQQVADNSGKGVGEPGVYWSIAKP